MKIQISSLRSRFAWRVFLLFLISALIPIMVAGYLAFTQVTELLTEQARDQLRYTAKSYGLSLLGRLQDTDLSLSDIRSDVVRMSDLDQTKIGELHRKIDSLAWVNGNGRVNILFGQAPFIGDEILEQAIPDRTTLYSKVNTGDLTRVYMLLVMEESGSDHHYLVAELSPEYLWGDRDSLPYSVGVSVSDMEGQEIYNSRSMDEKIILDDTSRSRDIKTGIPVSPAQDSKSIIAAKWEIFLGSHFNSPSWTISSQQPAAQALAPITTFKTMFPAVALLTLLAVALLSASQIRRQLVPLEKLITATRRISNRDFSQKVEINSNDEFQELAASLNDMAARLGRQFDFLTVLSEIDRSILSTADIDSVLETAINRVHEMISCDGASITIFDVELGEDPETYVGRRYCSINNSIERISFHPDDIQSLLGVQEVAIVDIVNKDNILTRRLGEHGMKIGYVFPILIEKQLFGFVILGYREAQCDIDDQQHARDLADRFAVALAAAAHEDKLYLQAHFDALTGLPNRHLLSDRLGQEISHAIRDQQQLAVMFLDLDRFKNVNDTSGHAVGDELLKQAAGRLKNIIHPSNTVARLGGDEFTIVLSGINGPGDVQLVAENIIETLSDSFVISGNEHFVSASIGITLFPGGGETVVELLKNADMAMYRAKETGRGQYLFYDQQMNKTIVEKNLLERDLRYAIERGEFSLHYQPQINLRTGQILSAEALIRWKHPERGYVSPVQFISLAEETGYVDILGEWVLREACRQFRIWQEMDIHMEYIAVNVSSRQFLQDDFLDIVKYALIESGIRPSCLELEITESTLMDDQGKTILKLEALRDMGVKISIDDFGTGYSSLAYLKRFPIDCLKIDRTFIRDLPHDDDATAITTSIIAMANAMKMSVVAEGVETAEQLSFLAEHNCTIIQGYYYSPPLTLDGFIEFARQGIHQPVKIGIAN